MDAQSNVVPFNFNTHAVRTIVKDCGAVWFVASDVAAAMEYRDAANIVRVLDDDESDTHTVSIRSENGIEQNREVIIINESGLYHAVLKSRKPQAKPFRKWVTSEVLPAIRKTGEYAIPHFRGEKTRKALPNGLSIEQQDAIKQLVKARAEALPEEKRAGATIKLWSSIKSKFRVGYKELPPENFTEALSLVARLPLEGELVEEAAPPMLQRFVISRREASNLHCLFTHVRSISGFINQVVPMLRMAESPLAGRYQGILSEMNFAADLLGDLRDRCKAEYQATMVAM